MNNTTGSESSNQDSSNSSPYGSTSDNNSTPNGESTGLPWPKSWKGAYVLVIANFAIWLALLLSLQEFCK